MNSIYRSTTGPCLVPSCVLDRPGGRVHMLTVVTHILLWLSIAPGSTLSTENTLPISNAANSSGASCALAVVSPNHHDLIRGIDLDEGGPLPTMNGKPAEMPRGRFNTSMCTPNIRWAPFRAVPV